MCPLVSHGCSGIPVQSYSVGTVQSTTTTRLTSIHKSGIMDLDSGTPSMDLFRPSKRKKIYRKRADADEDADADDVDIPSHASTIAAVPPPEPAAVDEPIADMSSPHIPSSEQDPPSIQDILRQRKAAQRRKAGIEFTNTSTNILGHQSASTALIKSDKEAGEDSVSLEIERLVSRFAPQTGHVAEANDKHMYGLPARFPPSSPSV